MCAQLAAIAGKTINDTLSCCGALGQLTHQRFVTLPPKEASLGRAGDGRATVTARAAGDRSAQAVTVDERHSLGSTL